MAIPPLSELITRVSTETVFAQEISVAQTIGLPATAWEPISIGRECLYINAELVSNFSIVTQEGAVAGGFLTYAKGAWLTLCSYETFDTTRIESSSATGRIRLANSTVVPYTFLPGAVRVLNETSRKTYTNTNGGTVPAGGSLSTTEFVADEPGTASNLTSTDTLSLVTTVPGVTPSWVENLIGQNEEGDEALRVRSREANAKASPNGPADAYSYYAKTTARPDGTAIGVTRTNKVQGNGTVTLYLADADGALVTSDRDLVFANVNSNVVPTGFTLIIPDPSCDELVVPVAITLTPNPDASAPQATTAENIRLAIVAYFSSIDVGGDKAQSFQGVYLSTLVQLIRNAAGDDVLNVVVTTPAANVALDSTEIPVLGTYTPTWTA
jgi:phage-related baseplate assembly protein